MRGCPRLVIQDPLREWGDSCLVVNDYDTLFDEVQRERFRIAVQIEEDLTDQAAIIAKLVRSDDVGNCVFGQDELSLMYPNRNDVPEEVTDVMRFGRRQNVSVILITQRPVDCPILLRSQLTDLYIFRTHEPNDIKWLRAIVGKTDSERALKLRGHQYIHFDLMEPADGDPHEAG